MEALQLEASSPGKRTYKFEGKYFFPCHKKLALTAVENERYGPWLLRENEFFGRLSKILANYINQHRSLM